MIDEDVLQRFGVDTVQAGRIFDRDDSCWVEGVLPDGSPCQWPVWSQPEKHEGDWVLRSITGKIVGHRPGRRAQFRARQLPFCRARFTER